MKASLRADEAERLAELHDYQILDTPDEPEFDDVTALASSICDAPISVVNLIDKNRQWFKSEVGLGVKETELDISICAHAILQNELFIVPDTTQDARFSNNPLVQGEPNLRFYAGALLRGRKGYPLGTLCVLDTRPRHLTAQQQATLRTLARHVMTMLELRRKEREHRLLNQRLVAALSYNQRLLATVAHDLRTPLSVVSLGCHVLEQVGDEPDKIRQISTRMSRASNSALRLTEDLLTQQARENAQITELNFVSLDVAKLVRNVIELMTPLAEEAQVDLATEEVSQRVPKCKLVVQGDAHRLDQVLTNLVGNAIKFTEPGGEVTVGWKAVRGDVHISVSDNGIGIAPESQALVFDPYVQVDSADARGAGLGLSIVKSIVEAHGGRIELESDIGSGSIFTVSLPLSTEEHPVA